ncbi:arginine repressor [Micrococcoides hystricis]|uniref:Arginine repressor n=1 Tax=Micrococcoides hystricis TaxID=1572761 RepID=A0ABV6P844_9MICC
MSQASNEQRQEFMPSTKAARHAQIRAIIATEQIRSQTELRQALAEAGIQTTQGTLSRDLLDLGALRVRSEQGELIYAISDETGEAATGQYRASSENRLNALCRELLVSVAHAQHTVVLRTPPGAAQFLASAIDQARLEGVLGTIAGDDSILLITTNGQQAAALAADLLAMTR